MMGKMIQRGLFLSSVVLIVSLSACVSDSKPAIIGEWRSEIVNLHFRRDGSVSQICPRGESTVEYSGKYAFIDDTRIQMEMELRRAPLRGVFGVSVKGDQLTLIDEDGNILVFKRYG